MFPVQCLEVNVIDPDIIEECGNKPLSLLTLTMLSLSCITHKRALLIYAGETDKTFSLFRLTVP